MSDSPPRRSSKPDASFVLTPDTRARLRADLDLDALELLLQVLPAQARELILRLAAREPDLLSIWEAAPALRAEDRGSGDARSRYANPRLQMYVVPRLEDVTLSDPLLQRMLRDALTKRGD